MRSVILTREMHGKGLAEWETQDICVKDPPYLATGDGVTDDTQAIRWAAYVAETEGKALYFPAGTYLFEGYTFTKTIRIFGEGIGRSIIQPTQADDENCIVLQGTYSGVYRLSFRRAVADRNKGTALRTENYGVTLEDVEFKFNKFGLHGAENFFYCNCLRVFHRNDSAMLIDADANNDNSYVECAWQNGFEDYNAIGVNYYSCDFSGAISKGDKLYQWRDPVAVGIFGTYLEWIDDAAGPIDLLEFVEDNATGVKRSAVIYAMRARGISGKVDSVIVADNVKVVVEGGYVMDCAQVAETANNGTAVVRNMQMKGGTTALKAGSTGSVHTDTSFFAGSASSTPIADGLAAAAYRNSYAEINASGAGLTTGVFRSSKQATAGHTYHHELYSGATLCGVFGVDGNKNVYVLAPVANSRIRLDAKTRIDQLIDGGQMGMLDASGYEIGADGVTRGVVTLWDGAGGNTPGAIKIASPNGTVWYLFIEDDGTVKVHNALPTANADGSEVGAQT